MPLNKIKHSPNFQLNVPGFIPEPDDNVEDLKGEISSLTYGTFLAFSNH